MLLATSAYLGSLPVLHDEIAKRMAGQHTVTFESQLAARGQAQQDVLAWLKQNKSVYVVVHFNFLEKTCPMCKAVVTGEHVELANSATGKAVVMPSLVHHAMVAHNQTNITEEDLDLGGNVRASREMWLNIPDALAALKDGTASPEVFAELSAVPAPGKAA